jgi:AAA+ ATPase superfamily predicted ATPase
MEFLDRHSEKRKLTELLKSKTPVFIAVYGRRRCGKSTLLLHIKKQRDIYFQSDQQEEVLQRNLLANEIARTYKGFDEVSYPNWESLFNNFNNHASVNSTLFIDEFPFLVKSSPSLPSVVQKLIDKKQLKYNLVICGSSQQMMQGMVMESAAPLYGRTDAIIRIHPLKAGWITQALDIPPEKGVEEFSVWGGVPRYWDLRNKHQRFDKAIENLLFDKDSLLYEEPMRLFLDDMRSAVQAYSIMALIGNGANRLTEISSRLEKSATSLSRPIAALIDMGYLKREMPFGENEKSSKRSLYKISDPFMNFYFHFVMKNKSRIENGLQDLVVDDFKENFQQYVSGIWENLCREAIPYLNIDNKKWDVAKRWWGTTPQKLEMELDAVALSTTGKHMLVGECKWSDKPNLKQIVKELDFKATNFHLAKGLTPVKVLFLKKDPTIQLTEDIKVYTPEDVMSALLQ